MYLFSFIGLLKFNKDKYKFIIPIIIIMLIFVPPSSFYYSNFRFRIPFEILSMIFYFNFLNIIFLTKINSFLDFYKKSNIPEFYRGMEQPGSSSGS